MSLLLFMMHVVLADASVGARAGIGEGRKQKRDTRTPPRQAIHLVIYTVRPYAGKTEQHPLSSGRQLQ